jgi:transcriptional regulator with XRE-family HTH domain
MPKYSAGDTIKRLRKQRAMSQRELSQSFMCRSHLSRIENGETNPSKETLMILFERLGYNPNLPLEFFLSEKESKYHAEIEKIENLLKRRQTQEANVLIMRLENDKEFVRSESNKQNLLYFKAASLFYENKEAGPIIELLMKAIKISAPKFKEEAISDYFLTKNDISIINMLSTMYGQTNQLERAIDLQYQLKENFDNQFMDNESKGRHYPMVILNLAELLTKTKKYEEAIKICDIGIKFCRSTSHKRLLPMIVHDKAICLYEIGEKEECEKLLRQAYYAYEMHEMPKYMEAIKNYVQRRPDIAF